MSVQTAGGKTLGFLIPISIFSFSQKCSSNNFSGTKAILFYPTKALINDQSDTIVKLVWRLNQNLLRLGLKNIQITFGILHGDVKDKGAISWQLKRTGQSQSEDTLRLKCPICDSQLQISYKRIGENGVAETIKCSGATNPSCMLSVDHDQISLFNRMVKVTRDSVYAEPPDILVATPDMINYRLFFDPGEQSIFGRTIKRCPSCSYTTANLSYRGACPYCGSEIEGPISFCQPKILVFDEAHQLRGSFGSQISYVMSRLEAVVKAFSSEDYKPVYIFSSATLAKPNMFVRDFFGQEVPMKDIVKADYLQEAELIQRVHLFMVPKGYSPQATLVQTIKATFQFFPYRKERYPNVLVFVNSLAEANELIHLLRHHRRTLHTGYENLPPPMIDGHSTDYGNVQRVEVEDGFSRGTVNVLVATSTLQVGLDFNRIDALVVYGAPFYLSDYVQRMGRAGRKHAAVILNILPNKPIDFFFFSNYPLITNFDVRDKALDSEAVRISRDNETIRRRSAVRALMDYLCTHEDAPRYYSDRYKTNSDLLLGAIFNEQKAKDKADVLESLVTEADLNPRILPYIHTAMRSPLSANEKRTVFHTIDDLLQLMATHGITSLSSLLKNTRLGFLGRINAGDLRQSDYMVSIDYPELSQMSGQRGQEIETSRAACACHSYWRLCSWTDYFL